MSFNSSTENMTDQIKRLLNNQVIDFDSIIGLVKKQSERNDFLDTFEPKSLIAKIFDEMESKCEYGKIFELLKIFCSYKFAQLNSIDYEMTKGINMLLSHQKFEEILFIYNLLILNKKNINSLHLLLDVIVKCYNSKILIKDCKEIVKSLHSNGYEIYESFWKSSIEGLVNIQQYNYADELLLCYPFRLSDTLMRSLIKLYIAANHLMTVFNIVQKKFNMKNPEDDYKSFEIIFNIFIEEITNSFENITQTNLQTVSETIILVDKITVKENILDKFLVRVCCYYKENFNIVENFLQMTRTQITSRTVEKIIVEYAKLNDYLSVFFIIKLCRRNVIPFGLEMLNLDSKIYQNIILFMMNYSDMKIEDRTDLKILLSPDNQYFYKNNEDRNINSDVEINQNMKEASIEIINNSNNESENKSLFANSIQTCDSLLDDYAIY